MVIYFPYSLLLTCGIDEDYAFSVVDFHFILTLNPLSFCAHVCLVINTSFIQCRKGISLFSYESSIHLQEHSPQIEDENSKTSLDLCPAVEDPVCS